MKKLWKRALALLLAASLTAAPAVSASWALGTEIHMGTIHLAEGVDYTRQYLWSATYYDLRTEHYLEYSPGGLVQPVVAYGDTVLSRETLSSLAMSLEADGKRVLGGINGDYFVLATGAPLGLVVTDGILRSSSSYVYAIGFDSDGNAFIGKPGLSITATFRGSTLIVGDGLNKTRTDNHGYVLYTSDFAETTLHTQPGIDVILSPVESDEDGEAWAGPIIGGHISCTVEEVLFSDGPIEIPEGKLILSINYNNNEWLVSELAALTPGDTVEIDISSADSRWESAVTAIGGLYKLVTDGKVESDLDASQAPRTAVGVRADGSTVFYTVDGRQSGYSVGASIEQVAARLVELGCVEAICLDGGGSTTLGGTLPGEDGFGLLNSPSDGYEREVTNALFLVTEQLPVGDARSLVLTPGDAILLSGACVALSALSVDAIGQTVRAYDGGELSFSPTDAGEIENGIFTAGTEAGSFTLSAAADSLYAAAQLTVVTTPDRITVRNESDGAALSSIDLGCGNTIDLTATAIYRNLDLICGDRCFTWSVTEGLGTIDQDGLLTAGELGGSGFVTVKAGERSVSIPLTVSGHIYTAEDFEAGLSSGADGAGILLEIESDSSYVRYGRQSARLSYDAAAGNASVGLELELCEERYLSMWIYGDGSGSRMSAELLLADGSVCELPLTELDFSGWQRLTVSLPDGAAAIKALTLDGGSGTIWLDQITVSNQPYGDSTPPTVTVSLSDGYVRAALSDNIDTDFSRSQISVSYDGLELDFTLSGSTVTAALPEADGCAHRVTVTAADASGNIGRASTNIAASAGFESPFTDMEGHWAYDYVNYLYSQGISNGVSDVDGLSFLPDRDITRGEFALMAARWLRLELSEYSNVELPFADLADIPDWCLDSVKAMYSLGILRGSAAEGGTFAYADRSITRAEAMTMLGRIQQKGYANSNLSFTDADSIPAWAAEHVASLVGQGAVNGYEDNTIAPEAFIKRGEMAKILYALR